jgi:hypothetical protein
MKYFKRVASYKNLVTCIIQTTQGIIFVSKETVRITSKSKGRAMAQVVSRRPLTTEDQVRSRVCLGVIYGGQSNTCTGFHQSSWVFPVSIITPWLSTSTYHLGDEQ